MGRSPYAGDWSFGQIGQTFGLKGAAEFFGAGGRPGAALARGTAGPEGAADTLESEEDNVLRGHKGQGVGPVEGATSGGTELVFVPERCGCRLCAECGSILGRKLRRRLHDKVGLFKAPRMMTLSVDLKGTITGKGFSSPEEAHGYVTGGRYIPKLMARLGITVWVWVLEFQKNGNPHWHVVFDASELEGQEYDYDTVWRWWRDNWAIGGWKASGNRHEFKSPEHALNYITKYVVKEPDAGYPPWVWEAGKRSVRFVGASKAVGRLVRAEDVADEDHSDQVDEEEVDQVEPDQAEKVALTYRERVQRCKSAVKAMRHRWQEDGSESWEFVGGIAVGWQDLMLMIAAGVLPGVRFGHLPQVERDGAVVAGRLVIRGRASLHVSDLERQIRRGRLLGGGELLEMAERRGFRFGAEGWEWSLPVESVA